MRNILHKVDPYAGFNAYRYPIHLIGWAPDQPVFDSLVRDFKPRNIIEVGTWLGLSATRFVQALQQAGLEGHVLCVDTWLGAREMWDDGTSQDSWQFPPRDLDRYNELRLQNGYPQLYYQFLANICHLGLQDRITPFPQTSLIAARLLKSYGVQADLVYIDGSHDTEDVLSDLRSYWPLVKEGGILLGDDLFWDSVQKAAMMFAMENYLEMKPYFETNWWYIAKPVRESL